MEFSVADFFFHFFQCSRKTGHWEFCAVRSLLEHIACLYWYPSCGVKTPSRKNVRILRKLWFCISKRRRDISSLAMISTIELQDPSWEFFSSKKDFWFWLQRKFQSGAQPAISPRQFKGVFLESYMRGPVGPLQGTVWCSCRTCRTYCRTLY